MEDERESKPRKRGVMFTFTMKSAKVSDSEKTKFFKELYGWTQTIPGGKKKYVYHREGVLEEIPHEKVNQSSFIIPENEADKMMDFFDDWSRKVMLRTFKILLEDEEMKDFAVFRKKKMEEEVE